ncbi:MAG TPA: hypothetical protein PKC29_14150 [Thermodesulfobacteriota bacterium]|nr:hypothetical protein [Thermodesulfobacteriota bacterium]
MKYSICVIDDDIPANQLKEIEDFDRITSSSLKYLLDAKHNIIWNDVNIKNLIEEIIKNEQTWKLDAFTNPNIFLNYISEEYYRPQIIILDYDIPGVDDFETTLQELLERSFSIVYIYSKLSKDAIALDGIKSSERFKQYSERIQYIYKETKNSFGKLLEKVEEINKKNISFIFGDELRKKTLRALDNLLIDIGKLTYNNIGNFISFNDSDKSELIDLIGHQVKSAISFSNLEIPQSDRSRLDDYHKVLAKKLWSNWIYFKNGSQDFMVRRGDIVQYSNDIDTLYMVVTGDCDLYRFWKKSFGFVNLLPLHRLDNTIGIDLKIKFAASNVEKTPPFSSLTNSRIKGVSTGPIVLPFIDINGQYYNYIGLPTKLSYVYIKPPNGLSRKNGNDYRLTYQRWNYRKKNKYKRLYTMTEPFLTPLVTNVIQNISNLGVPDYPKYVGEIISKDIENILK